MSSVGNRDANKGLGSGLGFGGRGRDMEEIELEEGEACSYNNNNNNNNHDYDPSVDPDIDPSYIGEKLQHVLGHFQKDCEFVDKSTATLNYALKERSSGERTDNFSTPETYSKLVTSGAPPHGPGPVSDAAQASAGPVLIEENWVCCDKCQKWRLLPLGTNPDNLPENWLCSMLNWLPGMDRCSVNEEETTKAVIALHQVPGPESRKSYSFLLK